LKKIRSLILADAMSYEEFFIGLKQMDLHLQAIIKDLRSQVVREACITIAYLAQILGNKFDKTAEVLLLPLINLIQNSAKVKERFWKCDGVDVLSCADHVDVRHRHVEVHHPEHPQFPTYPHNREPRSHLEKQRHSQELLRVLGLHLEQLALALVGEARGRPAGDGEERHRRRGSRRPSLFEKVRLEPGRTRSGDKREFFRAFRGFREHFPDQAEALLQSLEPSYRRALQGDGMSASSSNNNLAGGFKTPRSYGRTVATPHSATGRSFALESIS
jgi:CLIP-associating protein 1/2